MNYFSSPQTPINAWGLRTHTVFKAKKDSRTVSFMLSNKAVIATCNASSGLLTIAFNNTYTPQNYTESEVQTILTKKDMSAPYYLAIKAACISHTKSSSQSIFISGCIENNFEASKIYPGRKLSIELKTRTPFHNPFASGNEKEYFLIGAVDDTECKIIKYYGTSNEKKNEIVNFFGSSLPRPSSIIKQEEQVNI